MADTEPPRQHVGLLLRLMQRHQRDPSTHVDPARESSSHHIAATGLLIGQKKCGRVDPRLGRARVDRRGASGGSGGGERTGERSRGDTTTARTSGRMGPAIVVGALVGAPRGRSSVQSARVSVAVVVLGRAAPIVNDAGEGAVALQSTIHQ